MLLLLALACADPPQLSAAIEETAEGGLDCSVQARSGEASEPSFTWSDGTEGPSLRPERAAKRKTWTCTVTVGRGRRASSAQATWTADAPAAGMYSFTQLDTLPSPCALVALPDGRLLVATLAKTLTVFDPDTREVRGEASLGGEPYKLTRLVLDPRFGDGSHDWIYAWNDLGLVRYQLSLDPLTLSEPRTLFDPDCASRALECDGDLLFWSGEGETLLYLTSGQDGDTDHQDPENLGSKLIALRPDDSGAPWEPAFPSGYVVATGLRNPWRLVDCGAGLCIADPGDDAIEEINLYTAAGQNFGWPLEEGPGSGAYRDPLYAWEDEDLTLMREDDQGPGRPRFKHAPTLGIGPSAAAYGGRLAGWVLVSDFYDGWVRALEPTTGRTVFLAHQPYLIASAEQDGVLYAVDLAGGIYRLDPWEDRPRVEAEWLSDTHFAEATPYSVRYPLWSNGAAKDRALWLPDGATIRTDTDRWAFPDGAELFKTFFVDGVPVETRLITRQGDRWLGATFVWEDGEARRTDGRRLELANWSVPSEAACADCHDAVRGRSWPLGLEPFVLGDTGLSRLAGLLDPAPGPAPEAAGSALDQEARGYLHANCAMCHNPRGAAVRTAGPTFNLSYDAELDLLGQVANHWQVSHDEPHTALLVDPDDPASSVLTRILESAEMPYLAVWTPDEEAIAMLQEWIGTLDQP